MDDIHAAILDLAAAVQDLRDSLPRDAYRLPAAAQRLSVSDSHLKRLIRDGVVHTIPHMGGVTLVAQAEIDRVVSAGVAA